MVKCPNAVMDFVYYGGVNIYQEDLNDFLVILVITEELELKRLTGSGNESPQFEPEQKKPRAKLNVHCMNGGPQCR
jgi:hypothetical protein